MLYFLCIIVSGIQLNMTKYQAVQHIVLKIFFIDMHCFAIDMQCFFYELTYCASASTALEVAYVSFIGVLMLILEHILIYIFSKSLAIPSWP